MDIVDGDNAAEIAGGQRGLMMMLLASERANRASCSWTGTPLYSPLHPLPPIPDPVTTVVAADAASSLLPTSSPRRGPAHYPSFANSDIPISRAVTSCPTSCSWRLHSRISRHRPLTHQMKISLALEERAGQLVFSIFPF